MNNLAIQVKGLTKRFRIGKQERYPTIRESVMRGASAPLRAIRSWNQNGVGAEWIWALRNLDLEVNQGEVLGIIGRNGAGKSTLLKILSGITEPTAGHADIYGRIGSLLEVGTGFHMELTGRENVFMNAAILGMRRHEIKRKFDEIVAFAETEKFIDTPVKHYSSGMYMRLAFAVAAHLDPEILIVDEVLAVGDARFQKKCLNKMREVGHQGRTVLFVSHNMPAITRLCERAILLDEGTVLRDGPSHHVVSVYLNSGVSMMGAREWLDPAKAPRGEVARLCAVRVRSEDGRVIEAVDIIQPVKIEMEYEVVKPGYHLFPNFHLFNGDGLHIFSTHDTDPAWRRRARQPGRYVSTVWVPGNLLSDGTILVGVGLETSAPVIAQFYERDAIGFHVIESLDRDVESARGDYGGHIGGVMRPLLKWSTEFQPNGGEPAVTDSHQAE